ncbi:MAG: Methylaspartate ammonia-lyase [Acidimicrobiaceae bacterium]|nr:Methylaspartate ammonia-lyase [Acidimicrobiaceae bacterium]
MLTVVITDVVCVPVQGGFFTDDQAAVASGAARDGFGYAGAPKTPGFTRVRQPAEALSILLVLDDGAVAVGDCAAVQYAGAGGRDPVFLAADAASTIDALVAPSLVGRELTSFREVAAATDALESGGLPLHSAIRYGVTQALLDAVAQVERRTMAEVVRDEYATGVELRPVPMFVQSGDERYDNVDKMILKRVDVLPHGLINNVATKVGADGQLFADYVAWVRDRIQRLGEPGYRPTLHFDTYGTLGAAFGGDLAQTANYLARLGEVAAPFRLRLEHPIDGGSRTRQIELMGSLRQRLVQLGSSTQIVADEWCNTLDDIDAFIAAGAADMIHVKMPDLGGINNTIEALLKVRRAGLVSYCGGSCTETDRSAQVSAHVAMACGADQVLAKPGMGVDEGLMIVGNEMARVMALTARRTSAAPQRS